MPTKKHKSNSSLGKSLVNKMQAKVPKNLDDEGFKVHTTDIREPQGPQLKSILEQNSLEEFMQMAEMSQRKFEAVKQGQHVIEMNTVIPDAHGSESLQN